MSDELVRLAGSGRRADGAIVTWTIADGRRGRRWREVVRRDDAIEASLLYETGPDRRFTHLELATAAGLATLHPETDGTLHGNVVRPDGGVEHVRGLAGAPGGAVHVAGSAVSAAAVAWAAAASGEPSRASIEAVVLDPATLVLGRAVVSLPADADAGVGLPALAGPTTWPLEDDPAG